ncbi:MAG: substrate-binding domain-containing protein [Lentisphaeria bacterium]|nr:substrate-binding domain-containing protein [Lentisphaeria bacterium]
MIQRHYNSKAVQLAETLADNILRNRFAEMRHLPAENRLASEYRVSRSTIRRALAILHEKGIIIREPKQSSIIAPAVQESGAAPQPALLPGRSAMLGFVYAGFPDAMISEVTQAMRGYTEERNLGFQIFNSRDGHEPVLRMLENPRQWGIDGIFMVPHALPKYIRAINRLARSGYPVITLSRFEPLKCSSIGHDEFGGTFAAVTCLLTRYNRPVHYFGSAGVPDRYEAYRHAMIDAGFDAEIEAYTFDIGDQAPDPQSWSSEMRLLYPTRKAEELLKQIALPASVFCVNTYMAYGLYQAAASAGVRIGKELKVTGYGELPLLSRLSPPLAVVKTPRREIGRQAAELLHRQITGDLTAPVQIRIPVDFEVNESC